MPVTSTQKIVKSFAILNVGAAITIAADAYGPTGDDLGHYLVQAAPDGEVVGCTINSVTVQWAKDGANPVPTTCKLRVSAAPAGTLAFIIGESATFDTGASANEGYACWNLDWPVSIGTWLEPFASLLSTDLGRLYFSFKFDENAKIEIFLCTVTYDVLVG